MRAQVYELSCQFLPKEWIMEKWEEGFYITAMAGSNSGSSLVVMSKGTPYTQQSYKVGPQTALTGAALLHDALRCICGCARVEDPRGHSAVLVEAALTGRSPDAGSAGSQVADYQ